jgi:hypothetical protein
VQLSIDYQPNGLLSRKPFDMENGTIGKVLRWNCGLTQVEGPGSTNYDCADADLRKHKYVAAKRYSASFYVASSKPGGLSCGGET